jgi:dienelactone hydrolase
VSLLKRFWNSIKPSYHARRGAVLAAVATVIWVVCVAGFNIESGFGLFADFLFAFVVAALGIPLAALLVALILALLRPLPRILTGFFVACGLFISLLWLDTTGASFAALLLFVECALGATLATIVRGGLRDAPAAKRIVTWSILVLAVAADVGFFSLLHSDGINEELLKAKDSSQPAPLKIEDPSKAGPYQVSTLYYGSGNSLRRPEFGPSVTIRTQTVDGSAFFKGFGGWKAWIRKRYWGFGIDKLPLNARVFYPQGAGPFPLFLIVHGNHTMSVPSDNGYAYLCELLASRGFIAVSVDENFLNSGLFHDPPKQQAARGWLLLEHLRLWHAWAKDAKNPFFGKVDLNNIAVAGHSRGGEAAATAALFNTLEYYPDDATVKFHYGYSIKSVVAIAPPDGQYKPAEQFRVLKDVNYFTLQGANDADVSSFDGSRQYDHVRFSGNAPEFKSELYIYRANHGQFNTMWGRASDQDAPTSWFLDLRPLLSGDQQRQIAKVYISAFLEATLHGRTEYQDVFRDYRRGQQWLPKTLYLNRFQDQTYKPICSFDEDADVTSTTLPGGHISSTSLTVWREGKIPFRNGGSREYNGVFLGWNWEKAKKPPVPPPNYAIDLPPGLDFPGFDMSVAVTDDDAPEPNQKNAKPSEEVEEKDGPTEFSLEAVSANGASARVVSNSFAFLPPPFHVQFTKLEFLDGRMYKNSAEAAFQTIRIPFSAFQAANAAFDPHQVRRIRLIFDKTPSRVIIIGGIGMDGDAGLSK